MDRVFSSTFILTLFALTVLTIPAGISAQATTSQAEYWPTSGWITATPDEQGVSSEKLQAMEDYVDNQGWNDNVNSILVVRNGYLVYESYPSPSYDENRTHHIYSCTKSFTSALVGMAIGQGYIDGVAAQVLDFFPDLTIENLDSRKQAITIRDLLTMTSGLDWYDSTDYYHMERSSNWVKYVLDRPMAHDPGATWNYNTGGTHVLSVILNQTCPEGILAFAESQLFEPLGIFDYLWVTDNRGIPIGGTALNLLPRDMAKFGYLYLKNGFWDGEQIISEAWVAESTTPFTVTEFDQGHGSGYAYLWWTYTWDGAYAARGSYEQYIIVVPALNMVIVFTGSGSFTVTTLLTQYIFPAAGYSPTLNPLLVPLIIVAIISASTALGVIYKIRRQRAPRITSSRV